MSAKQEAIEEVQNGTLGIERYNHYRIKFSRWVKTVASTQLKRALVECKIDLKILSRMQHRKRERYQAWRTGIRDMGGGKRRPNSTSYWISRYVRERVGQRLYLKR